MVFEKLRKIIADYFGVTEETINMQTDFASDLDADSLDVAELLFDIEEVFGLVEIDETDLENIVTVEDLCEYISKRI